MTGNEPHAIQNRGGEGGVTNFPLEKKEGQQDIHT